MAKRAIKEMRYRLWVDINGVRFFGPGRAELLELIEETGSISMAAKSMGMSYKKAWGMIDEMNSMAQTPLVVPKKGGQKGGGTELTKTGKDVVKAYKKVTAKIDTILKKEASLLDLI